MSIFDDPYSNSMFSVNVPQVGGFMNNNLPYGNFNTDPASLMDLSGFGIPQAKAPAANDIYGLLGVDRNNARTMGLLAAASAFLDAGAGGRNPQDASLGRAAGRAALGGMGAYQNALKAGLAEKVAGLQARKMISDQAAATRDAQLAQKLGIPTSALPNYYAEKFKKEFATDNWASQKLDNGSVLFYDKSNPANRLEFTPTGGTLSEKERAAQEEKFRNFHTKNSGEFIKVRDAFSRIQASAKDPSAAGDLALIFNFMKALDPGSTVREGEFATAQNAAGVPNRVKAFYNNIMRGERMTDIQRADFVDRGTRIYRDALGKQKKFDAQVTQMVTAANLRPSQVLIDYSVEVDAPLKSRTFSFTQTDQDLAALAKEVDRNPDRFSRQYRSALEQELKSRLEAY